MEGWIWTHHFSLGRAPPWGLAITPRDGRWWLPFCGTNQRQFPLYPYHFLCVFLHLGISHMIRLCEWDLWIVSQSLLFLILHVTFYCVCIHCYTLHVIIFYCYGHLSLDSWRDLIWSWIMWLYYNVIVLQWVMSHLWWLMTHWYCTNYLNKYSSCILFPLIILDVSATSLETTCGKFNWSEMICKAHTCVTDNWPVNISRSFFVLNCLRVRYAGEMIRQAELRG